MISSSPFGYDNLKIQFNDENVFSSVNSESMIFVMQKEQAPEVSFVDIESIQI